MQRKYHHHSFWLIPSLVLLFSFPLAVEAARCLYVSSYHPEYKWDQGIRRGVEAVLKDECELSSFFMDTKRNKQAEFAKAKAEEAFAFIKSLKPDVVIAADDNASRYLVAPYLRDTDIPVVFCGINTSAEPYGYPYSNATGMVEVTPHRPLLLALQGVLGDVKKGMYLSAEVISQKRMHRQLAEQFRHEGIALSAKFVNSQAEWEEAWLSFDKEGFIFVGNPAGIADWDTARANDFVAKHADSLTFTAWNWLAPLAMITIAKEPEEQGEWAAQVALKIIREGVSPGDIPVVINRRWRMFVNHDLLQRADFSIPLNMQHIAERVE